MKLARLTVVSLALLLASLLIGGCGGSSAPTCGPLTSSQNIAPFSLAASTDSCRYSLGKAVRINFVATNTSGHALTMGASTPIVLAVVMQGGSEIWRSDLNSGGGGLSGPVSLEAGQTYPASFTWDQTDELGHAVAAGRYDVTIKLQVTVDGTPKPAGGYASTPISITLGG